MALDPLNEVKPGDIVKCRTADGGWMVSTARSTPRVDSENAVGHGWWLSVAVDYPGFTNPVNWPAQDVFRIVPGDDPYGIPPVQPGGES